MADTPGPGFSAEEAAVYDRGIRLWGLDAQRRLRKTDLLFLGLAAPNAEICKNFVLAGVNSATIVDNHIVTEEDLQSNFFLTSEDVGKNVRCFLFLFFCWFTVIESIGFIR